MTSRSATHLSYLPSHKKAKEARTAYVGQDSTVCTKYTALLREVYCMSRNSHYNKVLQQQRRLPLEHWGLLGETATQTSSCTAL